MATVELKALLLAAPYPLILFLLLWKPDRVRGLQLAVGASLVAFYVYAYDMWALWARPDGVYELPRWAGPALDTIAVGPSIVMLVGAGKDASNLGQGRGFSTKFLLGSAIATLFCAAILVVFNRLP
jgi:hypothetical protein